MMTSPYKVAVVGCGAVANMHARHLATEPHATLVAVVDTNRKRAEEFAANWDVDNVFEDLEEAIKATGVNAVQIATPPSSHASLVACAIRNNCHVLVEKPLALAHSEVQELYDLAATHSVCLAPDFILLKSSEMLQAEKWIAGGEIGDLVSVDAIFNYTCDWNYVAEVNGVPWQFNLPGGFLHNYISHPLYMMLALIGNVSGLKQIVNRSTGQLPQGLTDHMEMLLEGDKATGMLRLSFATTHASNILNIYGTTGTIRLDFVSFTAMLEKKGRLPGAIDRMVSPATRGLSYVWQVGRNFVRFAFKKLVPYEGLKNLMSEFYAGLPEGKTPIAPELALNVAQIEDEIVASSGRWQLDLRNRTFGQDEEHSDKPLLAITGATGYLGKHVVKALHEQGYRIRCLIRYCSDLDSISDYVDEVIYGDARNYESVRDLCKGAESIVHLAAGTGGSKEFVVSSCEESTANVIRVAEEQDLQRNVIISSFAVLDHATGATELTDDAALEPEPQSRNAYSEGKLLAEKMIVAANENTPRWVVLRPSCIFGGGKDTVSSFGMRKGSTVFLLGGKDNAVRGVDVADVVQAILLTLKEQNIPMGEVLNLSHPDEVSFDRLSAIFRDELGVKVVCMNKSVGKLLGVATRVAHKLIRRGPNYSPRQVEYIFAAHRARADRALALGWKPGGSLEDQLRQSLQ